MSIRLKLLVGCLCLTIVTLVLGAFAQNSQQKIGMLAVKIYDDALIATNALRSAQNALFRLEATFRAKGLENGSKAALPKTLTSTLRSELSAISKELSVAQERSLSGEGQAALGRIEQRISRLVFAEDAMSGRLLLRQLGALNGEVGASVRIFGADAFTVRSNVESMVRQSVDKTWAAMGIAAVIALAITLLLSRAIVPALRNAMSIANSIASGKFDNDIRPVGRSETAELLTALATMQTSISRHFGQIENAAASQADVYDSRISIQNARFEAALDNMNHGLCMFDSRSRLVVVNRRFVEMFGLLQVGTAMKDLAERMPFGALFTRRLESSFDHGLDDGRMVAVSRQAIAAGGEVFTFEDVSDRHYASVRLSYMASHDALTGLPNRMRLGERLQEIIADPASAAGAAVLCLDLDGFKFVNDTLGHPVGDVLLKAVADRLLQTAGDNDLVARIGGDEFAIAHLSEGGADGAEKMARTIIERLGEPFDIDHQRITIGVSIGIVLVSLPDEAIDPVALGNTMMKNADLALYAAKAKGRNTHCFFLPAMDERIQARRRTELDLATALENNEIEVVYQPFIDVARSTVSGFEALIRWRHPTRGMVSPAEFIPVAEEVGLIDPLGLFVLETACREAAGWPADIKVSVNLSPVQFRNPDLFSDVRRVLRKTGFPPKRLQLEITENVLLHDTDSVLAVLTSFRKLGIGISMDDFGTGYSSLGYLSRFPFDKVKIDQSFVRDLSKRENIAVVRAVIGLSRAMGISAIAEGVETAQQRDILLREGCAEMQGYFFSRPRAVSDLPQFMMRFGSDPAGATSAAPAKKAAASPSKA